MKKLLTKFMMLLGFLLFLGAGESYADFYLCGGFNNGATNNASYKFSWDNGVSHYKLNVTIPKGRYWFKVYSTTGRNYRGSWDSDNSDVVPNDNKVRVVVPSWGENDGSDFNLNLSDDMDLTFEYWEDNYGFNGVGNRSAIKVTGTKTVPTPTYPTQLYLLGDNINGSDNWGTGVTLSKVAGTTAQYSWSSTNGKLGSGFKVRNTTSGWDGDYNIGSNGSIVVLGTPYSYKNKESGNLTFDDKIDYVENPTVTVDLEKETITVTGTPVYKSTDIVLVYNNGTQIGKFSPTSDENVFTLSTKLSPNSGNNLYFRLKDGSTVKDSRDTGSTGVTLGEVKELGKTQTTNGLLLSNIDTEATYQITYWRDYNDGNTGLGAIKIIKLPAHMYIYGNINDWYSHPRTYVTMDPVEGQPGVYYAEAVEHSGQWDDNSLQFGEGRVTGESTGNDNFVAFFDHIVAMPANPSKDHNYGNDFADVYKYGSTADGDNWWIGPSNESKGMLSGPVQYLKSTTKNFRVEKGLYNVTFDFNTMTATWEPTKPKENQTTVVKDRTYNWWSGSDQLKDKADANLIEDRTNDQDHISSDYDGHAYYNFTYGDKLNNVIQAGIDNNPMHLLAKQVTYYVWYRSPDNRPSTSTQGVKRRAAGDADAPADAITGEDDLPVGFEVATEGEGKDYKTIGKDDYDGNYHIELLKAGDYIVSAQFEEDKPNSDGKEKDTNGFTYNVTPTSLFVTVDPKSLSLSTAEADNSINVPFGFSADNSVAATTLIKSAFSFSEELTYNTDFTVTIVPSEDAENWPSESDGKTFEEALNAVTSATLWNQYKSLGGDGIVVDGFYTSASDVKVASVVAGSSTVANDYPFNVEVNVPCSGVYTMTVNVTNTNYQLSNSGVYTVNVYPNLTGKFGTAKEYGFNIAGFTFNPDADVTVAANQFIQLPEYIENDNGYNIANLGCYIPGTYFASNFQVSLNKNNEVKRRASGYEYDDAPYRRSIDLSSLSYGSSSEGLPLYVTVSKNGASYQYDFTVKGGDTGWGTTTGVDAIGAEGDGEAEYFNLQGVKVQNPEHGIYVKVQNGKAEKVVL